jgi:putative transposase
MKNQKGHLWQGRYFSAPLDASYLLHAVRYVERNPVSAGMVTTAEDYPWSSALAHCGLDTDPLVDQRPRPVEFAGISDWSRWLREGIADEILAELRRNTSQNLPCGSPEFIERLEKKAGRSLRYRCRGGQLKVNVPFKKE